MDIAIPNLPSRDFSATARFYERLGFATTYRDDAWMILEAGSLRLEFFPHPTLVPADSWFSCCLRLDNVDAFYDNCRVAGIEVGTVGFPRVHPPEPMPWGKRMGALVDEDGSLLRLISN